VTALPQGLVFRPKSGFSILRSPCFAMLAIFIKNTDFMKTKKNPDAIPVNFPVVARPYLCYVSESKGFGFCHFMLLL
jgi:hypothetical protein